MFVKQAEASQVGAIISIHGQREYPVEADFVSRRLVLRFDDAEVPDEDDPLAAARQGLRIREAASVGLTITLPTESHARDIIEFARSIRDCDGVLLCQCFAGISRSPAAALLCLAEWMGPGREREAVRRVIEARPAAVPHRGLVKLGDGLLGRAGRLVGAMDEMRP